MNYKTALFCEIDKYAAESYCAVHDVDSKLNIGDITKADAKAVPDFNTMFGGSPCQDFSIAGKLGGSAWTCKDCNHSYNSLEAYYTQRDKCPKCGSTKIEKTRSSLLVEWLRFLREKKPRFAIYENVKNFTGSRFRDTFDMFVKELEEYEYNVYWQVLNAKHYGIPQNRVRVYCVIIRKDLDNGKFEFPNPIPLNITLSDLLENEVDEKYYLSDDKVAEIVSFGSFFSPLSYCIDANYFRGTTIQQYIKKRRRQLIMVNKESHRIRIRKLIPLETWRLMGFDDDDFEKARDAMNNNIYKGHDRCSSQLYKQAGNSIVVDVLLHIMQNLYNVMPYLFDDIIVGSFFSGIGAFEKALMRLKSVNGEKTTC